jgi:hypothetical protein
MGCSSKRADAERHEGAGKARSKRPQAYLSLRRKINLSSIIYLMRIRFVERWIACWRATCPARQGSARRVWMKPPYTYLSLESAADCFGCAPPRPMRVAARYPHRYPATMRSNGTGSRRGAAVQGVFHPAANNLAGTHRSRHSELMRSETLASCVVDRLKALVARTDCWTPAGSTGQRLPRHVAS